MQTKSDKALFPIGIGTWNISSKIEPNPSAPYNGTQAVYGNEQTEIEALRYSLAKGQNHIDCAEMYGAFYTDVVVGKTISEFEREDLYIADKLWKTSIGKDQVRPTVEKMLWKLGTDYIDLLYIHSPWPDWQAAIPQIDELIDDGLVRHFGVSNFTIEKMEQAQAIARHPIVANQMNFNVLYKTEATDEFRQYCQQHNIQVVAYQPIKRQEVLGNQIIQAIAQKHQATPAQVALAWLIAKGAMPIPKATQKQHIDENVAAAALNLGSEDMRSLDAL